MLDELVIDRHVEPQCRVGNQIAAHPVVEIAARRFSGDVELKVAGAHGHEFSLKSQYSPTGIAE